MTYTIPTLLSIQLNSQSSVSGRCQIMSLVHSYFNRLDVLMTENRVHFRLHVSFHLSIPISIHISLCLFNYVFALLCMSVSLYISYFCVKSAESEGIQHLLRAEQAESGWVVVVELRLVFAILPDLDLSDLEKK